MGRGLGTGLCSLSPEIFFLIFKLQVVRFGAVYVLFFTVQLLVLHANSATQFSQGAEPSPKGRWLLGPPIDGSVPVTNVIIH